MTKTDGRKQPKATGPKERYAAMLEDGGLEDALKERYAGWDTPEARAMLNSDLDTIFDKVNAGAITPSPRSGRQEILENYVNRFV